MTDATAFTTTRDFNAPLDLLWEVHASPEHIARWMGPQGFKMLHNAHDFREGGQYHYGMEAPDGSQMWGLQTFLEIVPKQRIVVLQSFSDAEGNIALHPMAPTMPPRMKSTATFSSTGPKTSRLTIHFTPWEASQEQQDTFAMARSGMTTGFEGMFVKIDEYLASLQG